MSRRPTREGGAARAGGHHPLAGEMDASPEAARPRAGRSLASAPNTAKRSTGREEPIDRDRDDAGKHVREEFSSDNPYPRVPPHSLAGTTSTPSRVTRKFRVTAPGGRGSRLKPQLLSLQT